jgi:RNA polymerase sigma-70 factor (ECF subfamily)
LSESWQVVSNSKRHAQSEGPDLDVTAHGIVDAAPRCMAVSPTSVEASTHSKHDEDLLNRARAGSDAAFAVLVARHQNDIYRLAFRLLTNRSDAEDIVQETFLRAWQSISSFDGRAGLRTWLHRIATNAVRMRRRAASRKPMELLQGLLSQFDDAGSLGSPDAARIRCADHLLEQKQFSEKARQAFEQLGERHRAVFDLRELEGASTQEVAKVLGISPASVRQRLLRARRTLRGYLSLH